MYRNKIYCRDYSYNAVLHIFLRSALRYIFLIFFKYKNHIKLLTINVVVLLHDIFTAICVIDYRGKIKPP